MAKARKVIITCAVTGSIHTPSMSPHLPVTADEITEAALGAAEAGASILHLHARDQKDGSPDQSIDAFMRFLPRIKQNTDAVVNITTGGAATMTIDAYVGATLGKAWAFALGCDLARNRVELANMAWDTTCQKQ